MFISILLGGQASVHIRAEMPESPTLHWSRACRCRCVPHLLDVSLSDAGLFGVSAKGLWCIKVFSFTTHGGFCPPRTK